MSQDKFVTNCAQALFEIADESKRIPGFYKQSCVILKLLNANKSYINLLSSVQIPREKRKKMLEAVFIKIVYKDILNFLKLLIDRDKFKYVQYVLYKLQKDIDNARNVQYGTIFSVTKLTDKQMNIIKIKISKKLNSNIDLINKLDPTLIGGIKIKINNKIFDGSIKNKLKTIKQSIIK
ncbi:F0F1 ATP synthase subunit delta [Spiroplasma endosymbiont of Amphibalanus improvisus]|uniref:F0F1 ATP synthase subunit delta n=1 Tax=Spiroplasma endosymbiont of Amphibalanus improvisus TaxID=3066327 RepID=UPI00313F0776